MNGYSKTTAFCEIHQKIFYRAEELVLSLGILPQAFQDEIRCHELARAVAEILDISKTVRDGKYGPIEHSWLHLVHRHPNLTYCADILDVYSIGRLPQVQIIRTYDVLQHELRYTELRQRHDIRKDVLAKIIKTMKEEMDPLDEDTPDEVIDERLKAAGADPEEVGRRGQELADHLLARHRTHGS